MARGLLKTLILSAVLIAAQPQAESKSEWDSPCTKNSPVFNPAVPSDARKVLPAIADFARHPDDQQLFFEAASYYFVIHNLTALNKLARETRSKHPDWAGPYDFLAKIAEANMEDEEALSNYKRAYQLRPCWQAVLMSYSDLLMLAGRYKEALEVAGTGLTACEHSKPPEGVHLRYVLLQTKGRASINLGDAVAATKPLEAAVAMVPPKYAGIPTNSLCEAYLRTKQWKKAIALMNISVQADKSNKPGYLYRAKAYFGDGELQKAQNDIFSYLKNLPTKGMERDARLREIQEAHLINAQIYERMGKKDLAQKERTLSNQGTVDVYKNTPFRATESGK